MNLIKYVCYYKKKIISYANISSSMSENQVIDTLQPIPVLHYLFITNEFSNSNWLITESI